MNQYFPKSYEPFDGDINVKVDLSNYTTKADIKYITHIDTSGFALKTNLATKIKLKTVPVDLSKLTNVAKNDVVKKAEYNKLVNKVNNIDNSVFVLKTKYDTDGIELENKIPSVNNLV